MSLRKIIIAFATMLTAAMAGPAATGSVCATESEVSLLMYRPDKGIWYRQSDACAFSAVRLGGQGEVIVPADYDGDRLADIAVWNLENGTWTIRFSSTDDQESFTAPVASAKQQMSDTPVPADFDGDGRADIAVWHSGSGEWTILGSAMRFSAAAGRPERLGGVGEIPVPADYDGDGRADIAVFNPAARRLTFVGSRSGETGFLVAGESVSGKLLPADYTGDGIADIAFFNKGVWTIYESESGEAIRYDLGVRSGLPVPGDYDLDGITDIAIFSGGKWIIQLSSGDGITGMEFGSEADVPVSSIPVREIP